MNAKGVVLFCLCTLILSVSITLLTNRFSPAISAQPEKQIVAESISIVDGNGNERISLGYEEGAAVIKLSNHLRNDIELRADPDGTCALHVSGTEARLTLDELDGGFFNLMTVDQSGVSYFASDLEGNHCVQMRLADERCSFGMDSSDGAIMMNVDEMSVLHTASTGWDEGSAEYSMMLSPPSSSISLSNGEEDNIHMQTSGMSTGITMENGPDYTRMYVVDSVRDQEMDQSIRDLGIEPATDPTPGYSSGTEHTSFRVYVTAAMEDAADLETQLGELGIEILGSLNDSSQTKELTCYWVGEYDSIDKARSYESELKEFGLDTFCTQIYH